MNRIKQMSVLPVGQLHPREEIGSDTLEKRDIVDGELRNIDVHDGNKHQNVFFVVELALGLASSGENSLQTSHTEIVMILGR